MALRNSKTGRLSPRLPPSAAWLLSGSQQTHNCGKAAGGFSPGWSEGNWPGGMRLQPSSEVPANREARPLPPPKKPALLLGKGCKTPSLESAEADFSRAPELEPSGRDEGTGFSSPSLPWLSRPSPASPAHSRPARLGAAVTVLRLGESKMDMALPAAPCCRVRGLQPQTTLSTARLALGAEGRWR